MKKLLPLVGILVIAGCDGPGVPSTQVRVLPVAALPADTSTNGLPLDRTEARTDWDIPGVTMEGYSALKPGDSYGKAVSLLGKEGTELSSSTIGRVHTAIYQWIGVKGNLNATFQNNKLVSKAQAGL